MRLAYIICVLFATTICCIATDDGKKLEDSKVTNQQAPDLTPTAVPAVSNGPAVSATPAVSAVPAVPAVPAGPVVPAAPVNPVPLQNSTLVPQVNGSVIATPTDNSTSANPKDTSVPTNATSNATNATDSGSNKAKVDDVTQGPVNPSSVEPSATASNTSVTSKPTTGTEPGNSTSKNGTSTVSLPPVTTPVPVSTKVAPNSERHFDGLSFMGGILLATCLMAIAAFSWKFYRTINERNYRTL